jgi:hypothetical protein
MGWVSDLKEMLKRIFLTKNPVFDGMAYFEKGFRNTEIFRIYASPWIVKYKLPVTYLLFLTFPCFMKKPAKEFKN